LQTLDSEGQKMDSMGFIGIWKIILIKNMPYNDMRRVGKIPSFWHIGFSQHRGKSEFLYNSSCPGLPCIGVVNFFFKCFNLQQSFWLLNLFSTVIYYVYYKFF